MRNRVTGPTESDGVPALEFGRFVLRLKRSLAARTERVCQQHPESADEIRRIMREALAQIDVVPFGDVTARELAGMATADEAQRN